MRDLVSHVLRTRLDAVLARSLIHCHTENLHSIMLLDAPGQVVRMFVAEPGHSLWRNDPRYLNPKEGPISLGFHPHHCELSLSLVAGEAYNWLVEVQSDGYMAYPMSRYRYNSQITAGKIGFAKEGEDNLVHVSFRPLRGEGGGPTHMAAKQIHTVMVPRDCWGAWIVMEGREDPAYNNVTWSNADLAVADFSRLYQPMTREKLKYLLSRVFKIAGTYEGVKDALETI